MAVAPQARGCDEPDPDREFQDHRAAVLLMLRHRFADVPDHEDLYQEAWLEALEKRAKGVEIEDLRALLKLIAWRRARDRLRDGHALPADPHGQQIAAVPDDIAPTDDIVQVSVDGAVVRRVVEQLDGRRAAAIKMRYELGMSSVEIEEALGINRRRLDKLFRTALRKLEKELTADDSGESPWTRKQRDLLGSCLAGTATADQRARARDLVDHDPSCRALLAEMRAALDKVAAALPMPALAELHSEHSVPVLDQLQHGGAALREALTTSAGRGGSQATALEPVASGGLASVSAAGAAKVVLVCLSLGGGAAACIEIGVLGKDPKPEKAQAAEPPRREVRDERVVVVAPKPTVTPRPRPAVKKSPRPRRSTASTPSQPVVRSNGPAPASPAPQGSEEFGPGSVGSVSSSQQPAAAPVDGGGEFTP